MSNRLTTLAPTPVLETNPVLSLIRQPGQLMCPQGLVFTKGERFMRRYMAGLIGTKSQDTAPLFSLIDGPPGTGKTVLATDALIRGGWAVVNLPAAMLAGSSENAATDALSDIMGKVVAYSNTTGRRLAVVIDDFHQSIAGKTTNAAIGRTVNSDLLVNELQRIADPPRKYRNACGTPVGLVFTGNDFSETAPSLFRDVRANRYTHVPTFEEKIHIIYSLLAPRTRGELFLTETLVRFYRHQPIAFWSALKHDLLTACLDDALPEGPLTKEAVDAAWPNRPPLNATQVWSLARARADSKPDNHY